MAVAGDEQLLLHLKLAILALEPPACVLTLARYVHELTKAR
jgi:hypothetical protein